MPHSDPNTIVSTDWLASQLEDPHLRILDASWYLPAMARDPVGEYNASYIPGAVFFDIDEISDCDSDLPHMVPPVEKFVSRVRNMGIGNQNQVVVYDGAGLFSAARVWWLFRLMGLANVAVLDGGLPKWRDEERALSNKSNPVVTGHLRAEIDQDMLCDMAAIARASETNVEIIDARPGPRFRGEEVEPRAGLRSGHIPGSRNVFFKDLLGSNGTLKSPNELRDVFDAANVDFKRPAITTCGSGVTAAIISLALEVAGHKQHALYDGSWAEWGQPGDHPVAIGDG